MLAIPCQQSKKVKMLMDIFLCILNTLGKPVAKNTNRYTHRNNVCEAVETENRNHTSYRKSCCDGKQMQQSLDI